MNTIELTILAGLLPKKVEEDFVFPDDLPQQQTTGLKSGLQNIYNFPWLYALAKNGNLRTYRIEVTNFHDHSVVTTLKATTEGGKWQIDSYEYWEGVNIGKANETTFTEQAMSEANSMYKKLLDKGFTPNKPKKGEKFNTDANGFMKPMLARSFSEKHIRFPCIVQPKYDGVRCLVFEKNNKVYIQSRQGKPYNIPHLQKWAEEHRWILPLDGELYNHKDLTFQEIVSAVKKHSDITPKIRYAVYDKPIEGVKNQQRWDKLTEDFSKLKDAPAYLSTYDMAFSMKDIYELHDKYVTEGYEGAIIRNIDGLYEFGFRSNDLIKLKSFMDSEYKIVDVVEATGRDAGTAVFVCECEAGQFNVKPMGTRELRAEYFKKRKKLIGKMVTVKYQELSDDGIPRFPSAISVRDYE